MNRIMLACIIVSFSYPLIANAAESAVANTDPLMAQTVCDRSIDPYPRGLYASDMLLFRPGYWINSTGYMLEDPKYNWKNEDLHPSRLLNPAVRVLGCPKQSLEKSLTLGHGGEVIVGPLKCFRNGEGPDVLIHEPRTQFNTEETINVFVTDDEKGKGPWYKIASNKAVNGHNNFMELELDGVVNARGYPIEEFRWVKIVDAESKVVRSNRRFSGFEVSAVKFMHQCAIPISWLTEPNKKQM